MKNTKMKYLIAALALLFSPFFALAQQNTLTQTTTTAALTSSATVVQVTSTTGMQVNPNAGYNTQIYVDRELMTVIGINQTSTGTNGLALTVSRGQAGTRAVSHLSGATVYAGRPNWFYPNDPEGGSCVLANIIATPRINIITGNQWICSSISLRWIPGFGNPGNSGIPPGTSTAVASVAGLTTISGPLFHVTGTNAITGWTIPVGGVGAPFCVIPDAIFTTTATNNIALASTAVVNKTLCFTWDDKNSKYTPSY